ncbi:hypothetical protein MRX96_009739 [Rhipicephalus microplus]
MARFPKRRHRSIPCRAAVSGHLSSRPPLTGRPTKQPVPISCFGKVRGHHVFIRQLVSLTPSNIGHCIFRNQRQATLARSHASRNHRAVDDQLRRQKYGHRGHAIPCRLLVEAVPRKTLSHRHVSAISAAMECLPPEKTQADKRHCLRQRLITSPVPISLRNFQIASGDTYHSHGGSSDNYRRSSTCKKVAWVPVWNIERDAQPPSCRFTEATTTQTRTSRGFLRTKLFMVRWPQADHWVHLPEPVSQVCLVEERKRVPRDIGIRSTFWGGECNLLYRTSDTSFDPEYSADSNLLLAGNEMFTTSGKQTWCDGAAAVY